MLVDLLNSYNFITINLNSIKIFGLNTSVYIAELLNIYKKAYIKNKLIESSYFKIDRKFISDRTSLTIEEQLKSDANLMKIGVINKHNDDPDNINFDFELFTSIISSEDKKLIKEISEKVKVKNPHGVKETKRQLILNGLKNSIECSNYELLTALRNWLDSIFANPNVYMSKKLVKEFQDELNNYTQGDLDLALKIVNIATTQSYRTCSFAINIYEKSKKYAEQTKTFAEAKSVRVTPQKKATIETISDKEF